MDLRWSTFASVCLLGLVCSEACGTGGPGEPVWFIHATDPDLFLPAAPSDTTKATVERQQQLNEKALTDLFQWIRSMGDSAGPPAFLALTGDLGVDPCLISPGGPKQAKACADTAVPEQRDRQIDRLARIFAASPVRDIYLVAGETDMARGDPGTDATGYFNKFLALVQQKLAAGQSGVVLHNLTACYDAASSSAVCDADILGTEYRLIGFPSWSFATVGADGANQTRQFETFRGLLERARQQGKKALILSHVPETDDPRLIAQSPVQSEQTEGHKRAEGNPQVGPTSSSLWKTSSALFDDWKTARSSDAVAAVFAGHLHDSHREIYRRPYRWSSAASSGRGLSKLYIAPPLALTGQESSPFQARGFSLVRLGPGSIESVLYWYDLKAGDFSPERTTEEPRRVPTRLWTALLWLWDLDVAGKPIERMATLLIALLAAFLTVMAISQIPPEPDAEQRGQVPTAKAQATSGAAPESSPFNTRYGKTIIAGLAGLVVAEVTKIMGSEPSRPDSRSFYILSFILFFFVLLLVWVGFRALTEAVRSRVALPYRPLSRRELVKGKVGANFGYWVRRVLQWFFSLWVPILTFFDTFINLIQGKNQVRTQEFTEELINQQTNTIRAIESIRKDLEEHIRTIVETPTPPPALGAGAVQRVRVNVSVMTPDETELYYISRSEGSARLPFPQRSVAWVSAFTGRIRWFLSEYVDQGYVLFDNSKGKIPDAGDGIPLDQYYQARDQDYAAFVMLPLPWPVRGSGTNYRRGAIHISFRSDDDLKKVWKPELPTANQKQYAHEEKMLGRLVRRGGTARPVAISAEDAQPVAARV